MSGVTWDERKPSDWLASNGRWYPKSKYPNGWNRSSLPPAPDHGGVGAILRQHTSGITSAPSPASAPAAPPQASDRNGSGSPSRAASAASDTASSTPAAGFTVARSVADATVTAQRTHTPRVSAGTPPPPALPSQSDDLPPPPGRVRNDAPKRPPAPTPTTAITPAAPPSDKTDLEVVAGDLGRVFGSAKKRIERALNEAAENQ